MSDKGDKDMNTISATLRASMEKHLVNIAARTLFAVKRANPDASVQVCMTEASRLIHFYIPSKLKESTPYEWHYDALDGLGWNLVAEETTSGLKKIDIQESTRIGRQVMAVLTILVHGFADKNHSASLPECVREATEVIKHCVPTVRDMTAPMAQRA